MITTKKKKVKEPEICKTVSEIRRGCGEVWTKARNAKNVVSFDSHIDCVK